MRIGGFILSVFLILGAIFFGDPLIAEEQGTQVPDSGTSAASILTLAPKLAPKIAELAINAVGCAAADYGSESISKLAIIDYSLPSTDKRFWLFDLKRAKLLLEDHVAHGKHTGDNLAESFSNTPGSLQSSLGLFRVGEAYFGKHGKSLRLIGLENGINDRAFERAIVIHGADYVSKDFIDLQGRLGRSFGCPALSQESNKKVIDSFGESGGFLFSYYPDKNWLKNSHYLHSCINS